MKMTKQMKSPRQYLGMGEIIKLIRKKRNLTQEQLGDKINVSKSYISKIETGKKQPNQEQLEKISEALNVSTYFLKHIDLRTEDLLIDDKKIKNRIIQKYNEINKILAKHYSTDDIIYMIRKVDEDDKSLSENEDQILMPSFN